MQVTCTFGPVESSDILFILATIAQALQVNQSGGCDDPHGAKSGLDLAPTVPGSAPVLTGDLLTTS